MASTTFVDRVTVIPTDWLNEVNGVVWTLLNGATTASSARTQLGLGTIATQNANNVTISGGTVSGVTITGSTITLDSPTLTTAFNAPDNIFRFVGSSDATKKVAVEVDGLTTATTRTLTVPDYDLRVGNVPPGVIMDYAGATVPTGWLECDGSAVSRTTYSALHAVLKDVGGTDAYGWGSGNGTTTFNLPDFRGRTSVGKGTGTVVASGGDSDVDTGSDTLTVPSNNTKWITGMQVSLAFTSGSITGASAGTYYIIRNSATTVKLASTLANAQNGTAVDFTAKSSPVWSLTHTLTARTLAEQGGEESHAMSITELLAHTHSNGLTSGGNMPTGGTVTVGNTGSTGGNAAMNNMQPFVGIMKIISY